MVNTRSEPQLHFLPRAWNISKSTIQRRLKGLIQGHIHVAGRKTVIPAQDRTKLEDFIANLVSFPMRMVEVRKGPMASRASLGAGYYWFQKFIMSHPSLVLRKSEALSTAWAASFNLTIVGQ